jgi:hypothetical protein
MKKKCIYLIYMKYKRKLKIETIVFLGCVLIAIIFLTYNIQLSIVDKDKETAILIHETELTISSVITIHEIYID